MVLLIFHGTIFLSSRFGGVRAQVQLRSSEIFIGIIIPKRAKAP